MVEPTLMTSRLALRRFTSGDADSLLELDSDPAVMRFLTREVTTRAQVEQTILPRYLTAHTWWPGLGYWAAEERGGGRLIGWFAMKAVTPDETWLEDWADAPPGDTRVVSLGYRLRRGAWGRGYATEGARELLRRAFTGLGVQEVVATTMAVNTGSRRVLEKAGLRHTRTLSMDFPDPLPGNEQGDVEYRVGREEWARAWGAEEQARGDRR